MTYFDGDRRVTLLADYTAVDPSGEFRPQLADEIAALPVLPHARIPGEQRDAGGAPPAFLVDVDVARIRLGVQPG